MKGNRIVVAVKRIPCKNVTEVRQVSPYEISVVADAEWEEVPIEQLASLTVADKIEDKNCIYTAQLKFRTSARHLSRGKYVWAARLANGELRTFGTAGRPYAKMTVQENAPDKPTDTQLAEVTVTYENSRFVPYLVP